MNDKGKDVDTRMKRTRRISSPTQEPAPPSQRPKMEEYSEEYKILDAKILADESVMRFHEADLEPGFIYLLMTIAEHYVEIDAKYQSKSEATEILKTNPEVAVSLKEAWKARTFGRIQDIRESSISSTCISVTQVRLLDCLQGPKPFTAIDMYSYEQVEGRLCILLHGLYAHPHSLSYEQILGARLRRGRC